MLTDMYFRPLLISARHCQISFLHMLQHHDLSSMGVSLEAMVMKLSEVYPLGT